MRSVQDALYNWLTIKTVAEARPHDAAAQETYLLFHNMLHEDHQLRDVTVEKKKICIWLHMNKKEKNILQDFR